MSVARRESFRDSIWRRLPGGLRLQRLFRTISAELTFPQGSAPGHFYSPIPARAEIIRDADRLFDVSCRDLTEIQLQELSQLRALQSLSAYASDVPLHNTTGRFQLPNDYFPAADAIVLGAILLAARPHHYIEIGSGFSSALVLDVRECAGIQLQCTFIEPNPERLRSLIRPNDIHISEIIEKPVQHVENAVFSRLGPGDILFVDGSHVSKVGSDVNDVLFRILPLLSTGVLIHFHDILWPFEYQRKEVLRGRSWNEAYLLRAFLANNLKYQIYLFSSWLERCHVTEWLLAFPMAKGYIASSLWITKQAALGS